MLRWAALIFLIFSSVQVSGQSEVTFGEPSCGQFRLVAPENPKEWLRHEQHALLLFDEEEDIEQLSVNLITRNRQYIHPVPLTPETRQLLGDLRNIWETEPDISRWNLLYGGYQLLIRDLENELQSMTQISIFTVTSLVCDVPFSALVPRLNEDVFWIEKKALSYIPDAYFPGVEVQDNYFDNTISSEGRPLPRNYEIAGLGPLPDQNRDGRLTLSRDEVKAEELQYLFQISGAMQPYLLDGRYVDESLALAIHDLLETRRQTESREELLADARWAQLIYMGNIAPLQPQWDFPFWLLVPIGLLLVIVFGKRL